MSANLSAQNAYKQNTVSTASPGELTLMLYNGCLKFLHLAKIATREKKIQAKNTNIQKAQAIIQELIVTLNMDYAISKNMLALYEYMNQRLMEANMLDDVAIIEEVEGFVTEFRDTWKEVIRINRQQQFGQGNSGQI
ncbi:flagellar export chaperone FliS [Lysinibacillus capsici]|uniref:Flagellar secretion chaperone FliS n=1 Tax=Lysinibacillus capsici TaxID=2115968 RepID=A0ABY8KHW2_9BACI|nr:flagellar export chaperone FliS [Lysinibacillus capsici]MDP1393412.1 flagellar export chaperone FliS [Lysinibacillus capsici]MDP1413886.1 flagellar export chaperone FliS [Lysinibacillus capsici]MDP1429176.1 flagellar export chaperone FliS [Lysinibacillus capsici]WGF37679.1 flagellar export chaperone FliS [Lysinibacillus capsici]